MVNTTIAISKELKEEIKEFASKKETYNDVIKRLLKSAKDRQLHDLLFDGDGVPIDEALERARDRWQE